MTQKPNAEKERQPDGPPGLPFPKKTVAAIRAASAGASPNKVPNELRHTLEKSLGVVGRDLAADYAHVLAPLKQRFGEQFNQGSIADGFEKIGEMISEIMCGNPTFAATVPIVFEPFDDGIPELIGSGVLIRILNRVFLLTAAHITDRQLGGNLMIPGRQGFVPISGSFAAMRLPATGRRLDDRFDVAYFWLDPDCAASIPTDCAILERIDVSLEGQPKRRFDYTFTGYPWRKGEVKRKSIETDFWTLTSAEIKSEDYAALGIKRSTHIAIRFNRKRMFHVVRRRTLTAPLPHGMSGGGVYAWSEDALKNWPVRLPLVGIATEFLADKSILVATRLRVFVRCIFHNQPDLAALAGSGNP